MAQNNDGLKLKVLLISEDEETFLCLRQYYANSIRTGQFLDDTNLQGRKFKLIQEESNGQQENQSSQE